MRGTYNALNTVFYCTKALSVIGNVKLHKDRFKDITISNPQVTFIKMLYFFIFRYLSDLKRKIIYPLDKRLRESPLLCKFMVFIKHEFKIVNAFKLNKKKKKLSINHLNDKLYSTCKQGKSNHKEFRLDPNWISGFVDAEGCFSVIVEVSKIKFVSVSFEINLHEKDIDILYKIKKFFGVGDVYRRSDKKIVRYRVTNINYIKHYIIPHFLHYPLISKKWADFLLWSKVVEIIFNKNHLTEEGFLKILSYYASINRGVSKKVFKLYPNILPANRRIVNLPKNLNPYWVSGFIAGDGRFSIYVRSAKDYTLGEKVYCRFYITQHSMDQELMYLFIKFFGCGVLNVRSTSPRCDYIVQDISSLFKFIVTHFDTYPLLTIKQKDYLCFRECINILVFKQHLTLEGLNRIKALNLQMNNNRKN